MIAVDDKRLNKQKGPGEIRGLFLQLFRLCHCELGEAIPDTDR